MIIQVLFKVIFLLSLTIPALTQTQDQKKVRQTWDMHRINDDYLIANSMNAADVDKDGFDDYSIIDEWLGLQTIVFFPKDTGSVRESWKRINLGITNNPEYSCLGDLDGDGNIDFVVATGDDLEKGYRTGISIIWGPERSNVYDSTAWINGGYIPSTLDQQYLYVECHNINGDGALDILVGGRRNGITGKYAGIRWLKAPKSKDHRRNLTKWESYYIDKDAYSGHGFVFADINQDGFKDIILADADWDTPAFERKLYWYENPGRYIEKVQYPWKKHVIWKNSAFYAKPQVAVGDVNGDGLTDLATQTQNFIHLFIKKAKKPIDWHHIKIKKPSMVQWIGRPIKFGDINMDGKMDIIAGLIHHDGNLPHDKASVFWLEYQSNSPADQWNFHPIKWSDGYNSYKEWVGEKWDHLLLKDIDQDGDMDIVGNVEEHYYWKHSNDKLPVSYFSVVWFENPLK
jgi:hypothetical protein